ncbi:histidine kinase [Pelomonas sp. KK5]|uniref:histidine kinase n=1 Tax=Pelomonas sp. KK5 TaxID=1855730 RepID=UPI0009F8B4F1|nr:histidine kinase [Pelomonas sp. KK5]
MSAALPVPRGITPAAALGHLLASWRSLKLRELGLFTLTGALLALIDLTSLLELGMEPQKLLPILTRLAVPVIASVLLLAAWLPADRSAITHPRRPLRLAMAALAGALLTNVALTPLIHMLPWPTIGDLMRAKKGLPPVSDMGAMSLAGNILSDFMVMAMLVAVLELLQRRRRSELSMQRLLDEHSQLRRDAMAARLAALQAQVEPQLLFDALVDIEQAYARGDEAAPARMEELIRHLRVALPRLREPGTTRLDAEAELLASYLAVLQGLGHPPMAFATDWPEALRGAGVPPMILLPLLQRALRLAVSNRPPARCELTAETTADGGLRVRLSFDRPGLAGDDAELQALAERVRVLSPGPARLLSETTAGETRFVLQLSPRT